MGLELELLSSHLPPIRTAAATAEDYGGGGAEDVGAVRHEEVPCSTPTAAANVLRAPSVCPPAPWKPRPRPPTPKRRTKKEKKKNGRCSCYRRRRGGAPPRWTSFVAVPDDLAKVFVPRPPADSTTPCRSPPDGKKIHVQVVG